METEMDQPLLNLETMIGFAGLVPDGLKIHPDGKYLIYPVGCTVVVENIATKTQEFLTGHTNNVSCIAVSRSGRFIASGQVTYMGFKADIIVWDYSQRQAYCKLTLHRNNVEALAFSPSDLYLASLGGQDDGSVVIWNLAKREAVCGSPAQALSAGLTHSLIYSNTSDEMFVTGGKDTLRIWQLNAGERKMRPTDVKMGSVKRVIRALQTSPDDSFFFCGTTTGDILAVNMLTNTFQLVGPDKEKFNLGVTSLVQLTTGEFLVGAGDGTIAVVGRMDTRFKRSGKQQKLAGAVTSIALSGNQAWIGTAQSNIYCLNINDFSVKLITTCHFDSINDVTFPHECGDLVATCSAQDIRLWSISKSQELLRIVVPNMKCNAIVIMPDGKSIISGWDDGRIRAYYPESGRPFYTMDNAYGGSVTSLISMSDCRHVISGSNLGHVVVWDVPGPGTASGSKGAPLHVTKHFLLKEHKAEVTCIRARRNDSECISSSSDGSCIIWDLIARCRRQMIRVNTLFKYVAYHPIEHQILTTGTDRKIGYWETFDGSMIRELDGSLTGSVNALDISTDGTYFVSGGDDKLIKVWLYDQGVMTHIGIGHSAPITRVKISPGAKHVISVSSDGAILRWTFPHGLSFH